MLTGNCSSPPEYLNMVLSMMFRLWILHHCAFPRWFIISQASSLRCCSIMEGLELSYDFITRVLTRVLTLSYSHRVSCSMPTIPETKLSLDTTHYLFFLSTVVSNCFQTIQNKFQENLWERKRHTVCGKTCIYNLYLYLKFAVAIDKIMLHFLLYKRQENIYM